MCSEYILECFAMSGPYLAADLVKVQDEKESYFPAHLAEETNFKKIPMEFLKLTDVEPHDVEAGIVEV